MAVETARDHAMHRLRNPQQQPARLSLSSEFRKYACTGARHMRASELPEPGEMLRHFGIMPAHHRFEVILSRTRRKGRYFNRIRIPNQIRVLENTGGDNADSRNQHQIPRLI